jgi:uncharacterized protein
MARKITIAFSFLLILSVMGNAQPLGNELTGTIRIGGRYVEGEGIELRFFPNKKAILETGFRQGFIIERSVAGNASFVEIARISPFSNSQWDAAMAEQQGNDEMVDMLDLAREFLKSAMTPKGGSFDFEQGINALRQQKADEDFEYAIFVLSAVRNAKVAEGLALSYFDKTVNPQSTYTYRVRTVGIPPVYTLVPEPYTIAAKTDKAQYANEVFVYEGDTELNFAWEESDLLSGYFIERQAPGETGFTALNANPIINLTGDAYDGPRRGSYKDENLTNYEVYTYHFYGTNLFGEKIRFAEVKAMPRDRTPPEQPYLEKPLHVAPQEVLLKWQMNPEPAPDLLGFIIGRSPESEGDYSVLNQTMLPKEARTFTDTTFVAGKTNYYLIQAVDTALNVSSSFPVAVTLIDTIPPAMPVFLSGKIDSAGVVTLEVVKNTEPDLMGYRLFKANHPDHEYSVINEYFIESDSLNHTIQLIFNDTVTLNSLTPNIYYKVKALDFNYNQSEFSEAMLIDLPDTIPPTTPVFTRVINSKEQVELHFALSESSDLAGHQLYRKTNLEAPWELYARLASGQHIFIDKEVEQGTVYNYSLRAFDKSGNYSAYAFAMQGKAYDDGVRKPVEELRLTSEDGSVILTWNYGSIEEGTFFVVYKTDGQGRLKQHRRTSDFRFTEKANSPARYALKVFTADGGQSPLSREVSFVVENE